MHVKHSELRVLRCKGSRRGRGFTLLELASAIAVFLLLAGIVTAAVARAQLGAATVRFERQSQQLLKSMVNQAATSDWQLLVDNSFPRPQRCDDDATASCALVGSREIRVTWRTQLSTDGASSKIRLTASSALPTGRTINASKDVLIAADIDETSGTVQIVNNGVAYSGAVYLLSGSTVAGAGVFNGSTAAITAPLSMCSLSTPCRVALGPDGRSYSGDEYTGDAIVQDSWSAYNPASRIVLSAANTKTAGVDLQTAATLTVKLRATNADGRSAAPTAKGSVCLGIKFTDGGARRVVACNTEAADRVVFRSFNPEPGLPARPLTAGTSVTLHTDITTTAGEREACDSVPGMVAWTRKGWVEKPVCTSWTWGSPATVTLGPSSYPFEDAQLSLSAGANTVIANWTSTTPAAAGYQGEPLWSKPRNIERCDIPSQCSALETVPETTECPGEHCYSEKNFLPQVSSPVQGPKKVHTVLRTANTVTFTLGLADADAPDDGVTTVLLSSAPANGVLSVAGTNRYQGAQLGSFQAKAGTLELSYTVLDASTVDRFTVKLFDDKGDSNEIVIGVATTADAPWLVETEPVVAGQGDEVTLNTTVWSVAGTALSGATVTVSETPVGSEAGASTVSGAGGTATPTLNVATTGAGVRKLTVSASAADATVSAEASLLVRARAGTVSLDVDGLGRSGTTVALAQGSTGSVNTRVRDRSGALMGEANVSFEITYQSSPTSLVKAVPAGCTTNTAGACSSLLQVRSAAPAGNYSVTARSGDADANVALSVASSPTRITVEPITVTQGGSTTVMVSVTDGSGGPSSNTYVSANASGGLSVSIVGATNTLGKVEATVSAAPSASAGDHAVSFTAGSATATLSARVLGVANRVEAETISVAQGASNVVELRAFDANGSPAANRLLSFTGGDLVLPMSLLTAKDGKAKLQVLASIDSAVGAREIVVRDADRPVGTITVNVVRGVASVVALDMAERGGVRSVRLQLTDYQGRPVTNASYKLRSRSDGVSVVANGVSDVYGVATYKLDVAADALRQIVTLYLDVDDRTIKVGVLIQ